ncbi:MAG: hypothetical protein ACRCTJ_01035 [Brevinema sp.]
MKKLLSLFSCFFLATCGQIETMKYEKIFRAPLGLEKNQIGSNIPVLKAYKNRQGLTDSFLIDTPKLIIRNKKIYIPDTYNKRISVFKINYSDSIELLLSIPNKGTNYEFARPYDLYVDRNENIFVLGSINDFESYEVQNYSNVSPNVAEYDKFQKTISLIPTNNFYIYKFSPKGELLLRFGLNNKPLPYPTSLSGDNFNNLYVYVNKYNTNNDQTYFSIYRYNSLTGNLNFNFNSQNINVSTNITGTNYKGSILSVKNFIHDEQLLVLTEYQPTTDDKGQSIPSVIDNVWSSVNVYSILENNFTSTVFKTHNMTEDILGVDLKGRIIFQSYNIEDDNLRIRFLDTSSQNDKIFYAPLHSSYYILNNYFIDFQGNLYNYIIDRQSDLILLKWFEGKKDKDGE